ncbi:hypothetical protein ACLOJK_027403 [Asimina triloba]
MRKRAMEMEMENLYLPDLSNSKCYRRQRGIALGLLEKNREEGKKERDDVDGGDESLADGCRPSLSERGNTRTKEPASGKGSGGNPMRPASRDQP